MQQLLQTQHQWTDGEDTALREAVEADVAAAVAFGLQGSPMQPDTMLEHLFA